VLLFALVVLVIVILTIGGIVLLSLARSHVTLPSQPSFSRDVEPFDTSKHFTNRRGCYTAAPQPLFQRSESSFSMSVSPSCPRVFGPGTGVDIVRVMVTPPTPVKRERRTSLIDYVWQQLYCDLLWPYGMWLHCDCDLASYSDTRDVISIYF